LSAWCRTRSGFVAGVDAVEQPSAMRRLPTISPTLFVLVIIPLTIKFDQPTALMAGCQSNRLADLLGSNPQTPGHRLKFALARARSWEIGLPGYDHQIDRIGNPGPPT
jgi:hypothetical protein